MYGVYFSYKNKDKDYLIERFTTREEAIIARDKYIVSEGERVQVKKIA